MTAEGRITIDIFPACGSVKIACARPLAITRRFSGLGPEEAVRTVSLLFATCRAAQTFASAAAFEDALGVTADAGTKTARALLILAETAREHGLRILMDWPRFLSDGGEQAEAPRLRALMQIDRDFSRSLDGEGENSRIGGPGAVPAAAVDAIAKLKAFLESAIFGEELDRWRARVTPDDLIEWALSRQTVAQRLLHRIFDEGLSGAGAVQVAALPQIGHDALAARLFANDADAFIARPDWEGRPCETSPLTRTSGHSLVENLKVEDAHGLGARLAASLVELASIPARMGELLGAPDRGAQPGRRAARDGRAGVGEVEAARGRLVHAVQLGDGKVHHYRILAPTEWNFHPEGAAANGLARLARRAQDDGASLARLFVTAVDPCVGADVRVR